MVRFRHTNYCVWSLQNLQQPRSFDFYSSYYYIATEIANKVLGLALYVLYMLCLTQDDGDACLAKHMGPELPTTLSPQNKQILYSLEIFKICHRKPVSWLWPFHVVLLHCNVLQSLCGLRSRISLILSPEHRPVSCL